MGLIRFKSKATLLSAALLITTAPIIGQVANAESSKSCSVNSVDYKPMAKKTIEALFNKFDASVVGKHFTKDFIQHNLSVASGSAPLEKLVKSLKGTDTNVTVHRVLQDGNYIVLHNSYTFLGKKLAAFDIWRLEDGKIVEHWDNLQPLGGKNKSGRTLVDGPTEIKDLEKTTTNKQLVHEFYHKVFVNGEKDSAKKFINVNKYIQHSAGGKDGFEPFQKFLNAYITKDYKPATIHRVIGEGNFVLVQAESVENGKRTGSYDLFRVENDKIVEHWDILQEVPANPKNNNGKF